MPAVHAHSARLPAPEGSVHDDDPLLLGAPAWRVVLAPVKQLAVVLLGPLRVLRGQRLLVVVLRRHAERRHQLPAFHLLSFHLQAFRVDLRLDPPPVLVLRAVRDHLPIHLRNQQRRFVLVQQVLQTSHWLRA